MFFFFLFEEKGKKCLSFYLLAADVSKAKLFPQKQEKPRKWNEDNQHRTAENVFLILFFIMNISR